MRTPATALMACASLLWLAGAPAGAGEFGVNLYGAAWHIDRGRAHQLGVDNEFNPGIGLRYRHARGGRRDGFADLGAYRDSGRNTALHAAAGALWPLSDRWRAGGALALVHSDTYNGGRTFIAPLPVLAYDLDGVTFNATWFPRVARFNEVGALGFWLTVRLP